MAHNPNDDLREAVEIADAIDEGLDVSVKSVRRLAELVLELNDHLGGFIAMKSRPQAPKRSAAQMQATRRLSETARIKRGGY